MMGELKSGSVHRRVSTSGCVASGVPSNKLAKLRLATGSRGFDVGPAARLTTLRFFGA